MHTILAKHQDGNSHYIILVLLSSLKEPTEEKGGI